MGVAAPGTQDEDAALVSSFRPPASWYGAGSEPESKGPGRWIPVCAGNTMALPDHIRSMKKAVASHGTGVGAGFKLAHGPIRRHCPFHSNDEMEGALQAIFRGMTWG